MPVQRCAACEGHWLRNDDYLRWREQQGADVPESSGSAEAIEANDTPGMLKCPEDGYFMARYRVGRGVPFTVDRCRTCGGAWLDGGEWAALRGRGLHDDLHAIFDEAWQKRVKQDERTRAESERLRLKLGDEDYARIQDVRAWLASHPEWPTLVGYLGLQGRPSPPEQTS